MGSDAAAKLAELETGRQALDGPRHAGLDAGQHQPRGVRIVAAGQLGVQFGHQIG